MDSATSNILTSNILKSGGLSGIINNGAFSEMEFHYTHTSPRSQLKTNTPQIALKETLADNAAPSPQTTLQNTFVMPSPRTMLKTSFVLQPFKEEEVGVDDKDSKSNTALSKVSETGSHAMSTLLGLKGGGSSSKPASVEIVVAAASAIQIAVVKEQIVERPIPKRNDLRLLGDETMSSIESSAIVSNSISSSERSPAITNSSVGTDTLQILGGSGLNNSRGDMKQSSSVTTKPRYTMPTPSENMSLSVSPVRSVMQSSRTTSSFVSSNASMADPELRAIEKQFTALFKQFVMIGGPKCLDVEDAVRLEVQQRLEMKNFNPDVFKPVLNRCLLQLQTVSVPAFVETCLGLMRAKMLLFQRFHDPQMDPLSEISDLLREGKTAEDLYMMVNKKPLSEFDSLKEEKRVSFFKAIKDLFSN